MSSAPKRLMTCVPTLDSVMVGKTSSSLGTVSGLPVSSFTPKPVSGLLFTVKHTSAWTMSPSQDSKMLESSMYTRMPTVEPEPNSRMSGRPYHRDATWIWLLEPMPTEWDQDPTRLFRGISTVDRPIQTCVSGSKWLRMLIWKYVQRFREMGAMARTEQCMLPPNLVAQWLPLVSAMPSAQSCGFKMASLASFFRLLAVSRASGSSLRASSARRRWSRARKRTSSLKWFDRAMTWAREMGVGGKLWGVHMNGEATPPSSASRKLPSSSEPTSLSPSTWMTAVKGRSDTS
mmetsp:Transcript_19622/g.59403  ORF Transcript_19622/g.59403 Transcript_19622/m.59403 type:complete len:289 (+) Transcript_19622:603-1469(+)